MSIFTIIELFLSNPIAQWMISFAFLFIIFRMFASQAKTKVLGAAGTQLKYGETVYNKAKDNTIAFVKESNNSQDNGIGKRLTELFEIFNIQPVGKDPKDLMEKIRHSYDTTQEFMEGELARFVPNKLVKNATVLSSITNIFYTINRILRHLILSAKDGDEIALMMLNINFREIKKAFTSYVQAYVDFMNYRMIGDTIGPLTVAHFVKEQGGKWKQDGKNAISDFTFEGRKLRIIKASGSDSNTGKVGRYASDLGSDVVITIDAALKMMGEETGAIRTGIGVAIGGPGYEKYRLEEMGVKRNVPLYAIIVPMAQFDAITMMPVEVWKAVPEIIDKLKYLIRTKADKGDFITIIGVGNTIGAGDD